ncbi:MAG: DUF4410 domain-containing protein [Desulfobulbus sp.]
MQSITRFGLLLAGMALLALMGCAPTTVNVVSQSTGALPQPNRILIYNFAVSPEEVKLDLGVTAEVQAMAGNPQPPWSEKELQVGRTVANALAEKLVIELRKMGYPAERVSGRPPYRGDNVLVIEGQITSVDQGSRAARVVIGLGAGHSDVKTSTQLYELQRHGRRFVEQFTTDARSSYKPGMAETEGASAAAGHWAMGLAVGVGLNIATEKYSDNVNSDAKRTAEQIAQQINTIFQNRGWVPTLPPQ